MLQRSAQVLLASLFFFVHVACVQTPVAQLPARDIAGLQKALADKCRSLLSYKPEQQFDFSLFCSTRDRIASGEPLTLEGWEQKTPEELMAIIEAFSMASFGTQKRIEEAKIKTSQARLLKIKIKQLQKSAKNQERRVRELVAYWYKLTHEQSAYRLLKNNSKSVEGLFVKISEAKRIERMEAELAKRGAIEAFESMGFYGDTSFWQKYKDYTYKKRNEKNLLLAILFTIPAVTESNILFAFFPVWDFSKVEKIADRYQEIALDQGHEKAHEMIRQESRIKGTFSTYAKLVAHAVNTSFMAALIMTGVDAYQDQRQAEREVIEMSASEGTLEEINQNYMGDLAEKIIKGREENWDALYLKKRRSKFAISSIMRFKPRILKQT
ncbi:MAG: hypothetical protein AABZ31_15265 [Bdellovibrionota bacterium]